MVLYSTKNSRLDVFSISRLYFLHYIKVKMDFETLVALSSWESLSDYKEFLIPSIKQYKKNNKRQPKFIFIGVLQNNFLFMFSVSIKNTKPQVARSILHFYLLHSHAYKTWYIYPQKCSRYTFASAAPIKFLDSTTSFKYQTKEHDQRKKNICLKKI